MSKYNNMVIYSRMIVLALALLCLAVLIAKHAQTSWNIFLALMGFSAVVFIHECGHFFVAKASDIKVEVFSVFIPPILMGIRRTEQGFRLRILPGLFPKDNDPDGDGILSFTFGPKGEAGETEYRVGLIPVAGYVKMLGQDDTGADKQSSDPRSFGNKSTGVRMAVISAGVIFNLISAVIVMMILYLNGLPLKAPVVGGVLPDSPAARAGLQVGDRVISIDGKTDNIEFIDIWIAAALSNKGEAIPVTVRDRNDQERRLNLTAEPIDGVPVRLFGILPSSSLTVAQIKDADRLYENTGLRPGDRITGVNGQLIEHYWQFQQAIRSAYDDTAALQVERKQADGTQQQVDVRIPLALNNTSLDVDSEFDLNHVCSLLPRLRITNVSGDVSPRLQVGDIVLKIGDVSHPTYQEMRDQTIAHEDKDLAMQVLRSDPNGVDQVVDVVVQPKRGNDSQRVVIGVAVELDAQHPIVAKSIATTPEAEPLPIPRGATITQIGDESISSFFDIIKAVRTNADHTVTLHWQLNDQSGTAPLNLQDVEKQIDVECALTQVIPLSDLEEIHKADHLGEAFVMGSKKCISFVLQTYVTLKQLISRSVDLKAMSGPVGIATITYQAVEQSFVSFFYLLAFISANLAVVNFLPIPVVDGGVFVLLIIERIKGSPLSIRAQEIITYAGLALILSVFLYLTYNDIARLIVR